jgi:hypothetical protein
MFQTIDQVPDHLRLRVYEHEFEGRDCWSEYLAANPSVGDNLSDYQKSRLDRTEQRWKSFIGSRGRHHALCTPADVEAYAVHLLGDHSLSISPAAVYWADIERFYRWMFQHAEYPHRYHPVVMAAVNYKTSRKLWEGATESA